MICKVCKQVKHRRFFMKSFGCPMCFFLNHNAKVSFIKIPCFGYFSTFQKSFQVKNDFPKYLPNDFS